MQSLRLAPAGSQHRPFSERGIGFDCTRWDSVDFSPLAMGLSMSVHLCVCVRAPLLQYLCLHLSIRLTLCCSVPFHSALIKLQLFTRRQLSISCLSQIHQPFLSLYFVPVSRSVLSVFKFKAQIEVFFSSPLKTFPDYIPFPPVLMFSHFILFSLLVLFHVAEKQMKMNISEMPESCYYLTGQEYSLHRGGEGQFFRVAEQLEHHSTFMCHNGKKKLQFF